MRRRLSWAAVGTSGVLAVIVATTMNPPSDSAPQRSKIVVPQADELDGYLPPRDRAQPETVFIPVVPPVAVTSATSTVPPMPPPPKAVPKPKPKPPAPAPSTATPPKVTPDRQSYPDWYRSYWDYYYRNRHHDRYGDRDRYDRYHR